MWNLPGSFYARLKVRPPDQSLLQMERKPTIFNLMLAVVSLIAIGTLGWSGTRLSFNVFDAGLASILLVSVPLGAYLHSQFPKTHLESTLLVFLVVSTGLLFGWPIAVIAAAVGFLAAGFLHRWMAVEDDLREIVLRASVAAVGAGAAWAATFALFGNSENLLKRNDFITFIWFVAVSTAVFGLVGLSLNWALYMFATVHDPRRPFPKSAMVEALMTALGGTVAVAFVYSLEYVSIYLVTGAAGLIGTAFWIYRRRVDEIRNTAVSARSNDRMRAELAEKQVRELEQYVTELEETGEMLQESHENFRHAAYHDALTGLPNRNYFIDTLKLLLQQSRERSELNFAILLLDLNRFKTINDSLGHSMGDRLIKNVGQRLSQMVREEDMVARFSGDKFGIILNDLLLRDEATAFAERLSKRIAEPYTLDGRQVFTNVKIGIAFGNSRYNEAEDILRDADIAMYYAKDNDESYVIFDQKMHIRAVTRLQLETDLRYAIERREFELYYQPIIGLESSSLVGFEALVRWNHPQRGLVPPNEFIPILESTGLIVPMTIQILHSACSQVAAWQDRSPNGKPLSVAVNLSGKHFADPNLVDQINDVLEETGIDPSCLKLELTESAVMENAETAILMLTEIKKTGVQISIDDFGTGYSSLSYLHRFPIDLLKVDRSFVSAMEKNSENGEIVKTVIALAKALRLKVVAEGIESIHQLHQLRILDCEYGQGYLFSKPLPVRDVEKLLQDRTRWQNLIPEQRVPSIAASPDISHFDIAQ